MKVKLMLINLSGDQFQLKIKSECIANDFNKAVLEFKLMYNKTRHRLIIKPISKLHFTQAELDILKPVVNKDNKELFDSLNNIASSIFDCSNLDYSKYYYMICDYNDNIRYVA